VCECDSAATSTGVVYCSDKVEYLQEQTHYLFTVYVKAAD